MKSDSPTLEGFRLMVRQPLFGMAEIAWRWSFGTALWLAVVFSTTEYLKTLPVSSGELLLLRTHHPVLVADAIAHIFRGSSWRVVQSLVVLTTTLAIGWTVLSSLARAGVIESLLEYFRDDALSPAEKQCRPPFHTLFGLNFFRVAVTLAAVIGVAGAFFSTSAISPASNPAPGSALLIFLSLILFIWLAWSMLNWVLSLAAVFVVVKGLHTFQAIGSAVDLCRRRMGAVLAVGTWFGLGHVVAFVLATSVVAFPLGFARLLPAGVVLGGVILVTLLYFAVADYLYVGRLAAYVAILDLPEPAIMQPPRTMQPTPTKTPPLDQFGAVDQGELILSDVPAHT